MSEAKQIDSEPHTERYLRDQDVVWRYVPLPTLFSYLNGSVFIPSIAKLRAADPFEGHCYHDSVSFNTEFHHRYGSGESVLEKWLLKSCPQLEQNDILLRNNYLEFIKETRFAWCWFHSCDESAAMWSNYSRRGVAVQSTIGRIKAALETTDREFIFGRMTYVDYGSDLSVCSDSDQERAAHRSLRPFFFKRNEYKSEDEVRFVTAGPSRPIRGGILLKNVKPEGWISAIRLWPGLNPDEDQSIRKAIGKFTPQTDCRKSNLWPSPLDSIEEWPYCDELANDSWKDGGDEIPPLLKIP